MFGCIHRALRGAARDRLAEQTTAITLGAALKAGRIRSDPYAGSRPTGIHRRATRSRWGTTDKTPRA